MKHITILIAILFCSTSIFAQIHLDTTTLATRTEVVNPLPDSTKLNMNKVYEDVKSGLTGLASALKVGAEHVYGILVKQQIVTSCVWLTVFLIGFLSIINWFKAYKSNEVWYNDEDYSEHITGLGIIRVIQIVISLILLITSIMQIDVIFTGFINPEYAAIKEIMQWVK